VGAVTWLRRSVGGLSPPTAVLDPKSVHGRFMVDRAALGQVFLLVLPFVQSFYRYSILTFMYTLLLPGQTGETRDPSKTQSRSLWDDQIQDETGCNGKSVPLQARRCPEGSRKLRFPDFMTTAQDGGKVVSLTHRPLLPPRKCSWYSFLLKAEPTPRP